MTDANVGPEGVGRHAAGRKAGLLARADAYRRFHEGGALVVSSLGITPLRVTGADRVDFVHGQVSNDVRGLPEGGTGEGLLLNHKGQALAQLRVVRRAEDLYLAVEAGAGAFVRERFEQHIIFDQVQIASLEDRLDVVTLQGARASVDAALATLNATVPAPGTTLSVPFDDATILVTPSRRSGGTGVDVHVLARHAEAVVDVLAASGAARAHPEILQLLRAEAGIAHAAFEGGDGVLPQEAGLDSLVSYRKGCYIGQEIMARIEARGAVRRRLAGLRLEGEPSGRDVVVGDRTVGRLGTVARHPDLGWVGLVVIRDDLDPGAAIVAGGVEAELAALPLATAPT